MASRSTSKKQPPKSKDSQFNFHLIGKKTAMGTSGAIVGAIVAGPVGALVGGAVGTALGAAAGSTSKEPAASTVPTDVTPKKKGQKPKSGRRPRGSRVSQKP